MKLVGVVDTIPFLSPGGDLNPFLLRSSLLRTSFEITKLTLLEFRDDTFGQSLSLRSVRKART